MSKCEKTVNHVNILKTEREAREIVKQLNNTCYSCRGPGFNFPHLLCSSQPSVTSVPEIFWDPQVLSTHVVRRHTCRQNPHAHKKN